MVLISIAELAIYYVNSTAAQEIAHAAECRHWLTAEKWSSALIFTMFAIACFNQLYYVDLEVWSKLAKHARIMHSASKRTHDFDCDWQRVNAFSHALLWYTFYFHQYLIQMQKCWFLLLWNISVQVWYV